MEHDSEYVVASETGEELLLEKVVDGQAIDTPPKQTIPGLIFEHGKEYPDDVAIRWKHYGVWEEYTWSDHLDEVRDVTHGLQALGVDRGDVVFTVGENRPHQFWTWLGTHTLGGSAAPHYPDVLPEEIANQLNLTGAKVVYAEDQQIVDKVLSIHEETDVETIIYYDPKGMFRYDRDHPQLLHYDEVVEMGRERRSSTDDTVESLLESVEPSSPALLTPTSGTTGAPKRVKLSHSNFINHATAYVAHESLEDGYDYFSFLPMAWVGEQMLICAASVLGKMTVNFPENPETLEADMREIGPEIIFSSPEFYEAWIADIKAKIENTTWLKRRAYEFASDVADRYAEYMSGDRVEEDVPLQLRALHELSYWTVYRPILDKLGIKRVRKAYTGGAPLGDDHFQFYHGMGINLKQAWGQTEVCGLVTAHKDGDIQTETCGNVFPNVSVGLLDNGELVVKGPTVTEGYYNQPEKTESAFSGEWLHSDDFGNIDEDGHVVVYDRMDDVIELADGTTVAPVNIEAKLKFNPYIKHGMVIGDGEGYLSSIVNIRYENVADWADQRNLNYDEYEDLAMHPEVLDLLCENIETVNEELSEDVRIERFASLFKEFHADDGELTRTGKLRRSIIKDRYASLVDGLYSDASVVDVETEITYEDGTNDILRAEVPIREVE